jgi:hypothetical protein
VKFFVCFLRNRLLSINGTAIVFVLVRWVLRWGWCFTFRVELCFAIYDPLVEADFILDTPNVVTSRAFTNTEVLGNFCVVRRKILSNVSLPSVELVVIHLNA